MSLVSNLFALQTNTMMASDSNFKMMNTAERERRSVSQGMSPGVSMKQLHDQSTANLIKMHMLAFKGKVANARAEKTEEEIKKKLDTFA